MFCCGKKAVNGRSLPRVNKIIAKQCLLRNSFPLSSLREGRSGRVYCWGFCKRCTISPPHALDHCYFGANYCKKLQHGQILPAEVAEEQMRWDDWINNNNINKQTHSQLLYIRVNKSLLEHVQKAITFNGSAFCLLLLLRLC